MLMGGPACGPAWRLAWAAARAAADPGADRGGDAGLKSLVSLSTTRSFANGCRVTLGASVARDGVGMQVGLALPASCSVHGMGCMAQLPATASVKLHAACLGLSFIPASAWTAWNA